MATKLGSAYVDIGANTAMLRSDMAGIQTLLKQQLSMASLSFQKMGSSATHAGKTMKQSFSGALKSALSMERVINRLAFIGTVGMVYAFGRAMQTAFKEGTRDAIEFESAMAHINTVLDDSAKQYLPKFREGIESLSVGLGKDVKDLSASMYDIISARIPPEHALYVLSQATELAVANQAELRSVVQSVLTILNAYNMEISETGRITDQLQIAIKYGRMEMTDLAPVLGDVTSAAAVLNIALEDVLGSLATMTRAGFNPKKAVTAMRRMFMAISEDAELSTKMQKEGFLSVVPIIEAMGQQQQKTITGGIRGFQAYAVAMQNWEDQGRDVQKLMDSEAEVAKALGIEMENSSIKIKQAAERNKKAWRDLGNSLKWVKPILSDAGTVFAALIKTMTNFKQMGKEIFNLGGYWYSSNKALNTYYDNYTKMGNEFKKKQEEIKEGLGKQVQGIEDLIKSEKILFANEKKSGRSGEESLKKIIGYSKELVAVNQQRADLDYGEFIDELNRAIGGLIDFKNELTDIQNAPAEALKELNKDINKITESLNKAGQSSSEFYAFIRRITAETNRLKKELEEMPAATFFENFTKGMEEWAEAWHEYAFTAVDIVNAGIDSIGGAWSSLWSDIADGQNMMKKNWGDYLKYIVDSFIAAITRMAIEWLAFKALMAGINLAFGGIPAAAGSGIVEAGFKGLTLPGQIGGGSFSPVINNSVNAQFSRRDMGWIVNEGMRYNNNTRL